MDLRRLYILLMAWCALVVAPGALVALGVFGPIDMNANIPGAVVPVWLVGYLGQLGFFMWVMNIVGQQKLLPLLVWWLSASLLPWAVDWTLPVSPLFLLLWAPVLVALSGWIAVVARRADALQRHGIRATGVVLEVLKPWMNVVVNNVYIKRKVRLRIERDDGAPAYEGVLNGLFMLGEIPSPGDRLALVVDPERPQRIEYDQGATQAAPSRSPAPSAAGHGNVADQLAKLAELRRSGALTDEEFAAAKKKLLR